jgi:hypothetical protein
VDPNVANMSGDPVTGRRLYNAQCGNCHSKDGPGRGKYCRGEGRPRVPALWGPDGYSRGAAFYNTPNLAGYIKKHMLLGDPLTLESQEALHIAVYINDQPRPSGMADQMFCHVEPDGIPAALRKPASWLVGCDYPGEPFTDVDILYGPRGPHHRLAQCRDHSAQRTELIRCGRAGQ